MKRILFAILPLFLLVTSCDKDDQNGTVELHFLATYDGAPLVMLEPYDYTEGISILFQRFNFYLSDVALLKDGKETDVLDIDFVEFDGIDDANKAMEGVALPTWFEVPAGDYDGIRIGLGVPAGLNATQASDYPSTHPLGMVSHYWQDWNSYIFTMINAKIDTNADGLHDDGSVLYHCGSDEVYRSKTVNLPISVREGENSRITFTVDLKDLFKDGNGYLDVVAKPNTHNINDLAVANQVMDNFRDALIAQE